MDRLGKIEIALAKGLGGFRPQYLQQLADEVIE